jgi:hypothetical protein
MDRPASHGDIEPGPEGNDRQDPEQSSHRLNIEGRGKISAGEPCETGGHAATGAGDSSTERELALVEAEGSMGPHSGGAGSEASSGEHGGETGAANEQSEKPAWKAERFGGDSGRKDERHVRKHNATTYRTGSSKSNI